MNDFLPRVIMKIRPPELAVLVKKCLRVRRRPVEFQGLWLWLDPASHLGREITTGIGHEPWLAEIYTKHLLAGETFVDLGANEGLFSLKAAKRVGGGGRVYYIEPQERLWNIIINNFILNDMRNAILIPYAVAEREGEGEIALAWSTNTGSSSAVIRPRFLRWQEKQKVQFKRLDTLLDDYRIERVHLLKVDIEGYEFFALRSAERALRAGRIGKIFVEFHPEQLAKLGQSRTMVVEYLGQLEYRMIGEWGPLYALFARQ